ncbi:amino acid ABC transporter permease [Saccharothrix xinjiangensis]|uniref:Amino acid ABC transporter permease n=1 Tax=Saccharothrix xinjiangensis TaxID=204798 RepID=A0ABV9XRY3_9PSEU
MSVLTNYSDLFLKTFGTTIQLFLFSAIGSLLLGTLLAMLRVSPVPVFRVAGATYVTLLRNTPLTLVFFFFAFAYPLLRIAQLDPFKGAVVALTLYTSAFICEVVRSGINTVPVGQAEAARALGLTFGQTLGDVILPQALRSVVPPLVSTLIALLKNTTVAAGFSVADAGSIAYVLSEDGADMLIGLSWVAFFFVVLVFPLTMVQRALEKRWSVAR